MSNFKIGEKVVSLKTFEREEIEIKKGCKFPIKGQIYTIREITNNDCLRFEELINPPLPYDSGCDFGEAEFTPNNFRKLDTQFAEDVISEIIEQVKKESLILSN